MSRIGRAPVTVPNGVEVDVAPREVTVRGPRGHLRQEVPPGIRIEREGETLVVHRSDDQRERRALHGLTRALVANMVEGVTNGFTRQMEIHGVGYRVQAQGDDLVFALGYSHPVVVHAPEGVRFEVSSPTRLAVHGIDKQKVGQVAANLRRLRRPDPYKGKGVRYAGEVIRLKAGKKAK